jgi:16S rRNA processing protein RimM
VGNLDHQVVVGTIIKPHGIFGEVVVQTYTDSPDVFAPGAQLWLTAPGFEPRLCKVRSSRPHQQRLLLFLEGVESRTDAERLRKTDLCIEKEALIPLADDECYMYEIVDAAVTDPAGQPVGVVQAILETAAGHMLEIRTPSRVFLLPFVAEFIQEVRRGPTRVVVKNFEGLLNLEP